MTKEYFPISDRELDRLIGELLPSTTIGNLAREVKERRENWDEGPPAERYNPETGRIEHNAAWHREASLILSPVSLVPRALDRALVEYRRWMPGHSGRIGNETFFVCREKDDGEVEWLARHPTAEAMRDDLDRRTVEAVIQAALGGGE